MKVTINKLASKRLLEAFAKVGACRTEEQAEARMSKLLGVPEHVIYYRSEEITEIDMRAATGEGSLFPARVSVEGSVPLYKLAALVKDALPTLAVGVVTYNNGMGADHIAIVESKIDDGDISGPWQEVRAQRRRPYGGRWIEIL